MIRLKLLSAILALLLVPYAGASELRPFEAAQFDGLQAAGKPIAVVVHATRCSICRAQIPIETELMRSPEFADFTMFTVDFDKDPELLKRFNVERQSAIIVFRGATEVARTYGDRRRAGIRATLLKGKG